MARRGLHPLATCARNQPDRSMSASCVHINMCIDTIFGLEKKTLLSFCQKREHPKLCFSKNGGSHVIKTNRFLPNYIVSCVLFEHRLSPHLHIILSAYNPQAICHTQRRQHDGNRKPPPFHRFIFTLLYVV